MARPGTTMDPGIFRFPCQRKYRQPYRAAGIAGSSFSPLPSPSRPPLNPRRHTGSNSPRQRQNPAVQKKYNPLIITRPTGTALQPAL